jgi:peptidoglycan/xylan/chitin deacetylase (PgdA/CDA1 family)
MHLSIRMTYIMILLAVTFIYGVGVGKFSWPPHDSISYVYRNVDDYLQQKNRIKSEPYIVITFDDGKESDYIIAYPLMAERGIKGTSYITTSWIGKEGYLNWEQVKELKQAGWTIGCHTHTHPRLTALVDEDIHHELNKVNLAFKDQGLSIPQHHAYPFGDHNDRVVSIVKQYRDSSRSLVKGYFTGTLQRIEVYPMYIQDDEYLEEVKNQIEYAVKNEMIIVLLTHDIKENPSTYGTDLKYFIKLLDYIADNNYKTATISEVYELIVELINE